MQTLLVDDNPDDRALILRELRHAFSSVEAAEVGDQKTFSTMLEAGAPDLVITDSTHWTTPSLRGQIEGAHVKSVDDPWGCSEKLCVVMEAGLGLIMF